MLYPLLNDLTQLKADGLISARRHPVHPLTIYNYTAKSQKLSPSEWTPALCDCRGLILDDAGEIIGRPFTKFWNAGQSSPDSDVARGCDFTVWEKLDGSLGIVCYYAGERIVATRGSFESDQAHWFQYWLAASHDDFYPSGETWLFEILFPENRIVVDYGDRKEAVLLSVLSPDAVDLWHMFDQCTRFHKAKRFDGLRDFGAINTDPQFAGQEGFVVQYADGFRVKVKLDEYCRLHRLITQCSTRTIWELLRAGSGVQELLDRVPTEFAEWVRKVSNGLLFDYGRLTGEYEMLFDLHSSAFATRKDFAQWAKGYEHSNLLFMLLDNKTLGDEVWKIVEPKWSTPFRSNGEDA